MNLKFNFNHIVHILFTISVVLLCSNLSTSQTLELGVLSSFEAYTGAGAATNGAGNTFTGDVGTNNGIISGFGSPPAFTGTVHNNNALTIQARIDLLRVYIHLSDIFVTYPGTHAPAFGAAGGGETITPGVYSIGGAGSVGGTLTLDGGGNPNAMFVIKFDGAFTVGVGSQIKLSNGTRAANVFWIAEGAISVGASSIIKGTLLSHPGAITIGTNGTIEGRLLATEGAITVAAGGVAIAPAGPITIPIKCLGRCTPAPTLDILGSIEKYALFSSFGAVANAATSGIVGNIGAHAGAISGFGTSTQVGTMHNADAATAQAKIDLGFAYSQLILLPGTVPGLSGTVPGHAAAFGNGETITAGVYDIAGAGSLAGTITLNGQNNPDAIFVFRFNGAFSVAAQSKVIFTNGTRRCNVFWVSEGAMDLGTFTFMKGTLLANGGACSAGANSNVEGRMLSTAGAIGFSTGVIYNDALCFGEDTPISGGDQTVCSDGTITQTLTATATSNTANGVIVWYDAETAGTIVNSPTQVGIGSKAYYAASYNGTYYSPIRTAVTVTITTCIALDTDGDGIPDLVDIDDDNDGILDTVEDAGCTPSSLTCDTDGDGIINSLDLDSDNDGINDVDEALLPDLNKDGIADGVIQPNGAIANPIATLGTLGDKDTDGNKDPYDALNGTTPDGTTPPPGITPVKPSLVDPTTGVVICTTNCDPDGDGILTPVDGLPITRGDAPDTDGDGIPDLVDLDDDNDGILDTVEDAGCTPSSLTCDTDGDGIINSLDLDSDNDGINDVDEALLPDLNKDGIADGVIQPNGAIANPIATLGTLGDKDTDGNKDPYDALNGITPDGTTPPPSIMPVKPSLVNPTTGVVICTTNCDPDGDGILTPVDGLPITRGDAPDTDGDGIPDLVDIDDDNDGILDTVEDAGCTPSSLTCDTDGDGIINSLDLDSDNDGINDVDEALLPDLDGDGIADGVIQPNGAIASPIATLGDLGDKDTDGNKDPYDALNGTTPDGTTPPVGITPVKPSLIDPLTGVVICTTDCDPDGDGILTPVDGLPTTRNDAPDTDGDGIPDLVDIDDDNDGILDTVEDAGCTPSSLTCDTDGDGIINSLDLDSDNDGINDVDEALLPDLNRDGIADGVIQPNGAIASPIATLGTLGDKDTDGNKDPYDALNDTTPDGTTPPVGITPVKPSLIDPLTGVVICTTNCDPDGDGILTPVDGLPITRGDALDTDGDGIPDLVDIDDDNDGILDTVEDAGCTPSSLTCDTDGDGIINSLDLDSDNDGINDVDEALLPDLNRDGIADGVIQPDGAIASPIATLSTLGDKDTDGNKDPYDALNGTTPDGTTPPPGITPIKLILVDPTTGVVICTTNCDPDGDGILTPVDGLPTTRGDALDTDGDGIPDLVDIDDDNDGILDTVEDAGCTPSSLTCDTDGDGIINSLDLDSDNDGINDVGEALLPDLNRDGIADGVIQPNGAIASPIATLGTLGDKDTDGNKDPYDALTGTTPGGATPPLGITPVNPTLVNPITGIVICTANCDPDGDGILTPVDGLPTTRSDAESVSLLAKVWLQGALYGVNGTNTIMRDNLRSKGLIPLSSPYPGMGLPETIPTPATSAAVLDQATPANDAIVDWVYLELRDGNNPSNILKSRSALLQRDGDIVHIDGVSVVTFDKVSAGNYYVAVRHRNHLGVMSALPIALSSVPSVVDFCNGSTPAFNLDDTKAINKPFIVVDQGFALWAGNTLFDKKVIYRGNSNDTNPIYQAILTDMGNIFGSASYKLKAYNTGDVNMDGETIFQGSGNDPQFIYQNIIVNHPGNVLQQEFFTIGEQLPL